VPINALALALIVNAQSLAHMPDRSVNATITSSHGRQFVTIKFNFLLLYRNQRFAHRPTIPKPTRVSTLTKRTTF